MKLAAFLITFSMLLGGCATREQVSSDELSQKIGLIAAYQPILVMRTEPGTRLDGEYKVVDDWAFFLGNTVGPTGQPVTPTGGISSDTVILFRKVDGEWQVIDHGLGISDAFYLAWPEQHGAPEALFRPELSGDDDTEVNLTQTLLEFKV